MSDEEQGVILLTGFEPFGRYRINSSWEAARIAGRRMGSEVVVARLPVNRVKAVSALEELLWRHKPRACLLTGLARGAKVRIERFGRRPRALAGPEAPLRLAGTWPVAEIGLALRGSKLSYRISNNAGRYVCDSTYWALMMFRSRHGWPAHAGFLHVPPLSNKFTSAVLARAIERIVVRRMALSCPIASETAPASPQG